MKKADREIAVYPNAKIARKLVHGTTTIGKLAKLMTY